MNTIKRLPDITFDKRFDEAVEVFHLYRSASTSLLQRKLKLGYTRAANLCDQMEIAGLVGSDRGAKGRELLITAELWFEYKSKCALARFELINAIKNQAHHTKGALNGKDT